MKSSGYRGFGIRFIAYLIDTILFYLICLATSMLMILLPLSLFKGFLLNLGVNSLLFAFYEIYLTHRFGGTLGKILLDIQVVNSERKNLSLIDSTLRYVSKWISWLSLGIGYLMICWDPSKQGLHDKIANTYVVDNPEPKISKKIKRILVTIALLLFTGYIVFQVFLIIAGFVTGVNISKNPLNPSEPLNYIDVLCDSKITTINDICIYAYSQTEPIISLEPETRIEVCSKIHSRELQTNCLEEIALYYKDIAICEEAETMYYQKLCRKTYEFTIALINYSYKQKEIKLKGDLTAGVVLVGVYDESFIELSTPLFTREDIALFEIVNFSGFEQGKNGLYSYDINVRIFNETGDLIPFTSNLAYGMGDLVVTNATLEKDYAFSELSELDPGNYTYEFTIYDTNTLNGSRVNKTITVVEKREAGLEVGEVILGLDVNGYTFELSDPIYTSEDIAVFEFLNVSGFEKGKDGFYHYKLDVRTIQKNGSIFRSNINVFDTKAVELEEGVLEKEGMTATLKNFGVGEYVFEFTLYDRNSIKAAIFNKTITIIEKPTKKLKVGDVEFGVAIGNNCIETKDNTYSNNLDICLHPMDVGEFMEINGMSLFETDLILYNGSGDIVAQFYNVYEEDGYVKLINYKLNQVSYETGGVKISLKGKSAGEYLLQLIIKDRFSKKENIINQSFIVYEAEETLVITDSLLGHAGEGYCLDIPDLPYTRRSVICLEPTVEGFKETPEGKIWFSFVGAIKTKEGKVLDETQVGRAYQEDPPLSSWHNSMYLSDYDAGEYIYELTVKDWLGGQNASVSSSFVIKY